MKVQLFRFLFMNIINIDLYAKIRLSTHIPDAFMVNTDF